jgi:hypothetical protein
VRLLNLLIGGLAVIATAAGPVALAFADSVPQALRGKSLVLLWTENRLQRRNEHEDFRPRDSSPMMQIYFSSEGRIFERRTGLRGSRRGSVDRVGGGTAARSGKTEFQGRRLVLVGATRRGGGRMINVEFEPAFSSCRVQVTVAREAGAEVVQGRSLITKRRIEYKPLGTSGENCSIQEGNVFGQ